MRSFQEDVIAGLTARPKSLPSKYLYDEIGSGLFESITRTAEYYPTRMETALLSEVAAEIAAGIPDGAALVEFGSGSSRKTRLLLEAAPQLCVYAPIDINPDALEPAARAISIDYPGLEVIPVTGDFTGPFSLPEGVREKPCVGFFPGSTIGNFSLSGVIDFLARARALLGESPRFLLGFDLVKDEAILQAAYDDAQGLTAAFNLNVLTRMNREFGSDLDPTQFRHEARWNSAESRMEMHLVSGRRQIVSFLDFEVEFLEGESIHTENSRKFTKDGVIDLAVGGGWRVDRLWTSAEPSVGLVLLSPA